MQSINEKISFNENEKAKEHFEELAKENYLNDEAESQDLSIEQQLDCLADIISNLLIKELLSNENK